MESRHGDSRNARTEAAAKLAADELAAKQESIGEENRGLLGSIQDGAKSLLSSVLPSGGNSTPASDEMESAAWRADEDKQQAGEYRGSAADKALDAKEALASQEAEEYIGAAAEKTGEYKEEALRKAEGTKQRAAFEPKNTPAEKAEEAAKEKTSEYTGTAAETKEKAKAKNKREEYDGTVADKAGESAAEKDKETKDATVQNAEETKDTVAGKLGKYKKSADKIGETKQSAKQKMEMDEEMRDHNEDDRNGRVATFIKVIKTKLSIPKKEIELGNPWAQGSARKETKVRHGNDEEGDVMKDMCRLC